MQSIVMEMITFIVFIAIILMIMYKMLVRAFSKSDNNISKVNGAPQEKAIVIVIEFAFLFTLIAYCVRIR